MCLGLGGETSLFVQIRSQLLCSLHGFQIELCRTVQWHWQLHRRQSGSLAVRSTVEARNDWYLWAWRFVQRPVLPRGRCNFLAEPTYNRHHRSFHGQNLVWRSVETENSKSVKQRVYKAAAVRERHGSVHESSRYHREDKPYSVEARWVIARVKPDQMMTK